MNFYRYTKSFIRLPLLLLITILSAQLFISGCASNKTEELVSSYYRFFYEDEYYRVRSVYQDSKGDSYNELLGPSFKATDLDQDGIIDDVEIGEADIRQVQAIYEAGLADLSNKNKLKSQERLLSQYIFESPTHTYLIISFKTVDDTFFNEFKILKNNSLVTDPVIVKDEKADGELDQILKGDIPIKHLQHQYEKIISKGLEEEELVKLDSAIVVRNSAI